MLGERSYQFLAIVVLSSLLLGGCVPEGYGSGRQSPPEMRAPQGPEGNLADLDRQIAQQQAKIKEVSERIQLTTLDWIDANRQLRSGKTYAHSSDYNAAGGQNPGEYNASRLARLTQDLTAQRKVLERENRKLESLESQRRAAQQQVTDASGGGGNGGGNGGGGGGGGGH